MDSHKNFAYSTVATAPSPATSGTSLVVATGDGAKFPAVPFNAVVWPAGSQPSTTNAEIVRVTGRSTDTLTIQRTQEGTSARTIIVGDQISNAETAKVFTDIENALQLSVTDNARLPIYPAPSGFTNGKFNAFGILSQHPDGTIVNIYREGASHIGATDFGIIRMLSSTDGGNTWTGPTTLFSEANVDLRNVAGGFTPTGRLVIAYGRYNPATSTWLSMVVQYSDDKATTWSTATTISPGSNTVFSPYGALIEVGGGKFALGWYGNDGTNYTQYALFSTDGGCTWGSQVTVATSTTNQYVEGSFAYCGGSNIVCLMRVDNGTTYSQALSTNNGTSFSVQGTTSFDSWTTSTDRPPTLTTFRDSLGMLWVACYYGNENTGKFRVTYAQANNLVSSASAWGVPITIYSTSSTDFGYGGVIQVANSSRAFGVAHDSSSASVAQLFYYTTGYAGSVAANGELDYNELTSTTNITQTVEASATSVIDGHAVYFDGNTRVMIEFCAYAVGAASGQATIFNLWDGSTDLGRIWDVAAGTGGIDIGVRAGRFLTPSAGAHTFHIKSWVTGGTGQVVAGAGGAGTATPAWYRITRA